MPEADRKIAMKSSIPRVNEVPVERDGWHVTKLLSTPVVELFEVIRGGKLARTEHARRYCCIISLGHLLELNHGTRVPEESRRRN